MAEGLFRAKTADFAEYCSVTSCGLCAMAGDPVSENAVRALARRGIDITQHRARALTPYHIEEADKIICLSRSHYDALLPVAGSEKLLLLGNGIPDPYGGNETVYDHCADAIDRELDRLLASDVFFSVEVMTADDVPEVVRIERENFSEPWSEHAFREQIDKSYGVNFTVKFLDKPIGYLCTDLICGEIDIGKIAVDEKFRRRGAADRLMQKLRLYAEENGVESLTLEVRVSNEPAQALYRKYGFETVGERKNFYREPTENAYIMTKLKNGDTDENTGN